MQDQRQRVLEALRRSFQENAETDKASHRVRSKSQSKHLESLKKRDTRNNCLIDCNLSYPVNSKAKKKCVRRCRPKEKSIDKKLLSSLVSSGGSMLRRSLPTASVARSVRLYGRGRKSRSKSRRSRSVRKVAVRRRSVRSRSRSKSRKSRSSRRVASRVRSRSRSRVRSRPQSRSRARSVSRSRAMSGGRRSRSRRSVSRRSVSRRRRGGNRMERNPWLVFVSQMRDEMPGVPYGEILKIASREWSGRSEPRQRRSQSRSTVSGGRRSRSRSRRRVGGTPGGIISGGIRGGVRSGGRARSRSRSRRRGGELVDVFYNHNAMGGELLDGYRSRNMRGGELIDVYYDHNSRE